MFFANHVENLVFFFDSHNNIKYLQICDLDLNDIAKTTKRLVSDRAQHLVCSDKHH